MGRRMACTNVKGQLVYHPKPPRRKYKKKVAIDELAMKMKARIINTPPPRITAEMFCKLYGVRYGLVRQALDMLVHQGFLYRDYFRESFFDYDWGPKVWAVRK